MGGHFIENHDPIGSTLYGLDVSVHPEWRGHGVGRALYQARLDLVKSRQLSRYGTACRLPGFMTWAARQPGTTVEEYVKEVVNDQISDPTLTPLLRYGLRFVDVIHDYMDDEESANAAALLDWTP